MKVLAIALALAPVFASALNLPSREVCAEKIVQAQDLVEYANDRFQVGEVTRTDVNEAIIDLADIQLECAVITRGDLTQAGSYCSQAYVDASEQYLAGIVEEQRFGSRTVQAVKAAKVRIVERRAICK